MSNILDLDIGNTFVKWRYGDSQGKLPTKQLLISDLIAACSTRPQRIRLSSVAAAAQVEQLVNELQHHWDVSVEVAETSGFAAGVTNSYPEPEKMGVDRWLAMVAAYNEFSRPCCVVDCGSAITVDYVDAEGRHQGGYIMPGLRLLRAGLLSNTERVLADQDVAHWHHQGPGKNTNAAVTQGLNLMLNAVANQIGSNYRELLDDNAVLVICGGDAEVFQQLVGSGKLRPSLVLDGLAYVLP